MSRASRFIARGLTIIKPQTSLAAILAKCRRGLPKPTPEAVAAKVEALEAEAATDALSAWQADLARVLAVQFPASLKVEDWTPAPADFWRRAA